MVAKTTTQTNHKVTKEPRAVVLHYSCAFGDKTTDVAQPVFAIALREIDSGNTVYWSHRIGNVPEEKATLERLVDELAKRSEHLIVGWNLTGHTTFGLKHLQKRGMALGVSIPDRKSFMRVSAC